jgi:outer membrane protein assembly factor BamB
MKKTLFLLLLMTVLLLTGCSSRGQVRNWPGLTVLGDTLYLSDGQVRALDVDSMTLRWQYPESKDPNNPVFVPAALAPDGALVVGGVYKDHALYFLSPENGAVVRTFSGALRGWVAPALVLDGTIYAPNADGVLYALDPDGALVWKFESGSPLWAPPVTDGTNLYVTALDHRLFALNLKTGQRLWEVTLPAASTHAPAMDVENGRLYLGGLTEQLLAIDTADGSIAWTFETQGRIWQTPVLKDGVLYFGDHAGAFYALDVVSQDEIWPQLQPDGAVVAAPLVLDDKVIFGTATGRVYAVSFEGEILWTASLEGKEPKIYTPPVLLPNGNIAIAAIDADAAVYVYSPSGALVNKFTEEE